MAKATIKSKSGAVITVEGTPEEVSNVISTFERATVVAGAKGTIARVKAEKKSEKKRATATDLIISLREDGFFEKPKTLGEIGAALEERGFLYPITTLSGVVLGLVKSKQLRRKKQDRKWVYGK